MIMLKLILPVIFFFSALNAQAYEPRCPSNSNYQKQCISLAGITKIKDGWPPNLVVLDKNKRMYGIGPIESELYPDNLLPDLPPEVSGQFVLCPLGKSSRVPYQKKPINLYCIAKYKE